MANYMKVLMIGRMVNRPTLRHTESGTAVSEVVIAINRWYTTAAGEKKEEACFVPIIAWQKKAELLAKYGHKNKEIFVEGRLELDSWEVDNEKRSKLRVVAQSFQFLGHKDDAIKDD